jgi:Fe(3+) dicitrate transport protein
MKQRLFGGAFVLGMAIFAPTEGETQTSDTDDAGATASQPAESSSTLATDGEIPPVEVVQPKPEPAPAVEAEAQPQPKPRPRPVPRPVVATPPPPPPGPVEPLEPELTIPNQIVQPVPGYYGPPGGRAAYDRAMNSAQNPIDPLDGIVPGNLEDFSSAASRVTRESINEQDPLTTNDILQRVPGVAIINDDGFGRHGGISIRGAPARRSRKILVMEDGRSINMSLWLDPSTHYVPPPDRLESVEVLRGTVIAYGPNNNHGVVNFRNIQPFGPNETVMSGQGGINGKDASLWHVHTRKTEGNWGAVFSYSGANGLGSWDTERSRYNDFYAALGWRGVKSDFTLSTVYFRQRDNYDESNLELEGEGDDDELENEDLEEDTIAFDSAESAFFANPEHCKTCYNPGSVFNTYNADVALMQGVYNYYFDADTTMTARVYGQHHRRDRYQNFEGANPLAAEGDDSVVFFGDDAFVPEGVMLGRLRTYNHVGGEVRGELANRPFLFGLSQDLQMGARYEHHTFKNSNFFGRQGQILDDGDKNGVYVFDQELEADAWSFFLQTEIPVTPVLNIVPGARLEHYRISRQQNVLSEEEGEGEELDECEFEDDGQEIELFGGEECVEFEVDRDGFTQSFTKTQLLPGLSFSYTKLNNTTLYGGYHRGLTMGVLREAAFPPDDEIGNNFQVGVRSTAIKGITFDVAGFHQLIDNYQIKGASTDAAGNNVYSNIDQVEINGVEIYSRVDSRPHTGWKINPFAEGSFTFADSVIAKGVADDGTNVSGNLVPETPRQFAYLTAGIESVKGWNASVSFIYRGRFYTDEFNTPYKGDPTGEDGEVPSVWLVAARANYTIPNTNAVLYISGENLTDEYYITDREDGIKPGLGRRVMLGARYKW